ncbi:MAG: apolipoprotein N-acyltransferase [Pseudomonadota bacterium]|nr:apolipoprotein N-acyltransferase [Pseudomonadota bacterium]
MRPVSAIDRWAGEIILLWGWRRVLAALVAGALSALAMPPFHFFPVLFVTLPVLVWLVDATAADPPAGVLARFRRGFATGWFFGFGYFLAGLWWLGNAFLVEADQYAWMLPIALTVLPALLAVFWGAATGIAVLAWREGWPRILLLSALLALGEYLRGMLFTGFPWNTIGYAAMPAPVAMQTASLIGLYGVTVLSLPVFGLLALRPLPERGGRSAGLFALVVLLLAAVHLGYGAWRLHAVPAEFREGVVLRIVQPSIDQAEKWSPEMEARNFNLLLELSALPPAEGGTVSKADEPAPRPVPSHIIWPESAFPFVLTERPDALSALDRLLPEGTMLIAGAMRVEPTRDGGKWGRVFNSIYTIDAGGGIGGAADKVHLVPFGEYLPLRELAESLGIRQLTHLEGGFEPGAAHRLLEAGPAGSFLPLICYEIIFPGVTRAQVARPDFIVNVTNDAWYGLTPGPYQHWHQAVVRGVEEGLPVVRAANNGISSVTDAAGRTRAFIALGRRGVLDARLPLPVPATLYTRMGEMFFHVFCVVFLIFGLFWARSGHVTTIDSV